MWEESVSVMEKKGTPRQASTLAKSNSSFERKSDTSTNKFARCNRRRENGNGRGGTPDFSSRKPAPQKNRSTLDKRPRSRGYFSDRQREEIVEGEEVEAGSALCRGSKKGNLNHLLNFTFAARENVVGSTQRLHTRPRRVVYNKERYLQANCQFVVKDTGDYKLQATDPDALVDWDLIEQVRMFSHEQGSCPICLQAPLAGKITRCGHVYCWACILHYLSYDDKSWRKCPICYEAVHNSDLRSVNIVEKQDYKVGDTITLQLMKRARGSTYAAPLHQWEQRDGCPQNIADETNTEYAKVLVASAQQIRTSVLDEEHVALQHHMATSEPSEVCFIESALVYLAEREAALQGKALAEKDAAHLIGQLEAAGGMPKNGSNGEKKSDNNVKDATSVAEDIPALSAAASLPKNLSFDGSKIRRQYADAFDELEDVEDDDTNTTCSHISETCSHILEDVTDEDNDSLYAISPKSSHSFEHEATEPLNVPASNVEAAVKVHETSQGGSPPETLLSALPPEVAGEATMTAEEAIEDLALPGDLDTAELKRGGPNTPKDSFYFYQGSDGQHIYLNSLNTRCIVSQYGSLENAPHTITARIVDKEVSFMTEIIRKRLRYLNHLPLTCEFQVVEVALKPPVISEQTLQLFADEIKRRAKLRQKRVKDDKRKARTLLVEERIKIGIYPEVKLALDNPEHFPVPMSEGEERRRQSSLSDASLPSPTLPIPSELNANAAEFVPGLKLSASAPSDIGQSSVSFAAALKKAKQAPVSPWGLRSNVATDQAASQPQPTASRKAGSDESDNEDRVPVPVFQASFSDAIQRALEKVEAAAGSEVKSQGKKKKKEKKLLFSTSMMRR